MIFRPDLENEMHVLASIAFLTNKDDYKEIILLEFTSNFLASSSLTDGTVRIQDLSKLLLLPLN